jgi:hypothetical protein
MADLLNKAFKEVFTREDTTNIPTPEDRSEGEALEDVKFRTADVRRKIKGLRQDGAAGPDGIGPKILQELREELSHPLAVIFNKSMEEGVVPQDGRRPMLRPFSKRVKECTRKLQTSLAHFSVMQGHGIHIER